MDAETRYDINVVLRHLQAAAETLGDIPFTIESASAWNAKTTASCEVAFAIGYLGSMIKIADRLAEKGLA